VSEDPFANCSDESDSELLSTHWRVLYVRGFHMYKYVWTPTLNECLQTQQAEENSEDQYAIAIIKEDSGTFQIVGYVPRELSRLCWFFL